jgi:hypothetical protein
MIATAGIQTDHVASRMDAILRMNRILEKLAAAVRNEKPQCFQYIADTAHGTAQTGLNVISHGSVVDSAGF